MPSSVGEVASAAIGFPDEVLGSVGRTAAMEVRKLLDAVQEETRVGFG